MLAILIICEEDIKISSMYLTLLYLLETLSRIFQAEGDLGRNQGLPIGSMCRG